LVALVHRDLDKAELAVELHRRYPPKVGEPSIGRTYSTGRTDVLPVIPEDLLPALAADLQHLELLQRLALSSAATVAVANDDRVFAVIAIANGHGRYVTDSDVSALERVAARLATELANAGTQ
jgi:GAF domain-containing protein